MRKITDSNKKISTILAFALIPLSGLATDIYIPSFPDMAVVLHATSHQIQQTMVYFLISYGVAQFFVGSIIDSFGRYRLNLMALFVFVLSNLVIVASADIHLVHLMRVVQGIATAFIVVGKRALFVDIYTGKLQKHYTGMLSIIWATAPIVAPFIGGFLQKNFGWASNFYLLAIYGSVMFMLELIFSGESLKEPRPFALRTVLATYRELISTRDFSTGILVLGTCYSMVMIFSMSAAFIVEQKFHFGPVTTGYCALLSGTALFFGGIIGKSLTKGTLFRKIAAANALQLSVIILMLISAVYFKSLGMLLFFVALVHLLGGLIYNRFFTYCLTRFPLNAGMASGITSGGSYLITSVISSLILFGLPITDQRSLAIGYFLLTLMMVLLVAYFRTKEVKTV